MKFIIDAQLPKSLSFFLQSKGFDAIHTLDLPQQNKTTDSQIIFVAEQENRVVITKDNDFLQSFLLKNIPQKLILLKTGNIHNQILLKIFEYNIQKLSELLIHHSLTEITVKEIIVHV